MAYYTATGNPGTQTSGRSGTVREEFLLIQTGFGQASNDIQALATAIGIGVTTTENDIASATVTDIGNGLGNVLRITGTNAINSFGANYTGAKQLRFSGILTLLNNSALLLPGGANITTAAGDVCIAVPIGNPANGWRVLAYCRMSKALIDDDAVRKSDAGAQVVAGTLQSAGFLGNLLGNVSGTATNVTGTVGIANGGTGATTAATARAALAIGEATQSQEYTAFTTAGTSTAYTLTPTPAITAYAAGQSFWVTFHVKSGAAPTLAISGVATPPNLVKQTASGAFVNIAANEIPLNHRSRVTLISATQALVDLPFTNACVPTTIALIDGVVSIPTATVVIGESVTVTDNGIGDLSIVFGTTFTGTPIVQVTVGPTNNSAQNDVSATIFSLDASSVRVRTYDVSTGVLVDTYFNITIWGKLP